MRRMLLILMCVLGCASLAHAQAPVNPCKAPLATVTENPTKIFFESDIWVDDFAKSITFYVYEGTTTVQGQGSVTDFTVPKGAGVERVPEIPNCYGIPSLALRDSPNVKKDRTIYHLRAVINHASGSAFNSDLSAPSSPFRFGQTTPVPTKFAPPIVRVGS